MINKIWNILLKLIKSFIQFLNDMWMWAKSPNGISGIVLIITLVFLILTFQYAYRPYVGVIEADIYYNKENKDLTSTIKIKNTGNIPANNVQTNTKVMVNSQVLADIEGKSRFVLFPQQETFGYPAFHNVTEANLRDDKLDINLEIKYELPIRFIIRIYTRKFKTVELLRYDSKSGKFQIISGESI